MVHELGSINSIMDGEDEDDNAMLVTDISISNSLDQSCTVT